MSKLVWGALAAACVATSVPPMAQADRAEPPPLYGYYDVSVDFARQTFNGVPTPMESKTFPVLFTTHCDVNGCVVRMDNSGDLKRNPKAPSHFDYRWNGDRWETIGEYPYFCDRSSSSVVVKAIRSDYLIPEPDGSFHGERTLVVDGAGCPGEGAGTHWVPTSLTPTEPPPGSAN